MSGRVRDLATPHGPARLAEHDPASDGPDAGGDPPVTLLLSHGAGAGTGTHDLRALAAHLPSYGVAVVLLDQPWVVAGRRIATAPPTLDDALMAAVDDLRARGPRGPLVVGGRSAGARSAARCADRAGAVGCLALSFPLHPPGRPERSRLAELLGAGVPTLVVQGERDAMGLPGEYPPDLAAHDVELAVVPAADHGLAVLKRSGRTEADTDAAVVDAVRDWLGRLGATGSGTPPSGPANPLR